MQIKLALIVFFYFIILYAMLYLFAIYSGCKLNDLKKNYLKALFEIFDKTKTVF